MPILELNRRKFVEQFSIVASAVSTRTPKEVLKSVLMVADGQTLSLLASDTEIHVRAEMPLKSAKISVLLPTVRMLAILKEITDETLSIDVQGDKIGILWGLSSIDLSIADASDFPEVPMFDADSYFVLNRQSFSTAIKQTQFCCSTESQRYALAGILLEREGDKIAVVATDSRRLAISAATSTMVNDPQWDNSSAVLPLKAAKLVDRILETSKCDAHLSVKQGNIAFRIGDVSITAQLIQGRFPTWQKVTIKPNLVTRRVMLPVTAFASVLRQAMLVTNEETRGLNMSFAKNNLTVSVDATGVGRAKAQMPIVLDGEEIVLVFDGKYIAEMLRVLDSSLSVEVQIVDVENRMMLVCGDYRYIVMPISKA